MRDGSTPVEDKIDEERDMAVLNLPEPTTKRTALVLCPSDDIRTGESVAAIGYPAVSNDVTYDTKYDLTDVTVTGGVLSKKTTSKNRGNCSVYQTDADINGGNSGGPLVNSKGQVIGINTFYRAYGDAKLNYPHRHHEQRQDHYALPPCCRNDGKALRPRWSEPHDAPFVVDDTALTTASLEGRTAEDILSSANAMTGASNVINGKRLGIDGLPDCRIA